MKQTWSVRGQLRAGFGSLAVICMLIAGFALWGLSEVHHSFDQYFTGVDQRARAADHLGDAMKARAIEARNAVLATDDGARQHALAAAREIKSLIANSVEKVDAGSRLVGEAGEAMQDIVTRVDKVSALIRDIDSATEQQAGGIQQISQAVGTLEQGTQQNAALVEQSAAAAESLRHQAAEMNRMVATFRLDPAGAV